MRTPAGIELLSEGSWNPGSVSGEWSPGGCGCGSGAGEPCSCGGSCGCKGEGGGSCGGGKTSGEVPLLPDYEGEIWASTPMTIYDNQTETNAIAFGDDPRPFRRVVEQGASVFEVPVSFQGCVRGRPADIVTALQDPDQMTCADLDKENRRLGVGGACKAGSCEATGGFAIGPPNDEGCFVREYECGCLSNWIVRPHGYVQTMAGLFGSVSPSAYRREAADLAGGRYGPNQCYVHRLAPGCRCLCWFADEGLRPRLPSGADMWHWDCGTNAQNGNANKPIFSNSNFWSPGSYPEF
jgi:hypothetical protein